MTRANIFQIFYSEETRKLLDPGFIPLDNLSNERPDWREYWPIRRFLKSTELRENEYYGFLSPRFKEKTGLSSQQVKAFIEADYDVISFSPFFDQSSFFVNIFEQGDVAHRGLVSLAQQFLGEIGCDVQLKSLVMDSRHVIFANYFVAKPSFWQEWLKLTEKLFHIAEHGPSGTLKDRLNSTAAHETSAPAKVFIIERLASLMLATESHWRIKPSNSFVLSSSSIHSALHKFPAELIILDALKIAYNTLKHPQYGQLYAEIRNDILRKMPVSDGKPVI